jgi:PAS domain S-box-containing protein
VWLLGMAAVAAVLLGDLRAEHARVGGEARERLQQQARLLEQVLTRQLVAIDTALASVVHDLPTWQSEAPRFAINRRLAALDAAITGARTLLVTDAQGRVYAANRPELVGVDVGDRAYFKETQAGNDAARLYIAAPFRSVLGVWSLNLARTVQKDGGGFAGVVTATIDPQWLAVTLGSVNFAPDMWAAVVHGSGRLLLMTPNQGASNEGANLAVPGSMYSRHRDSGLAETVFAGRIAVTGQAERVIVQRNVQVPGAGDKPPMVLALSRDLGAVHAGWRDHAGRLVLFFASLVLGSGLALAWMQRAERRAASADAAARQALQAQEQRWVLALDASGLGVWDIDLRSGRKVHSRGWWALLGVHDPQREDEQQAWRQRLHPEDAADAMHRFEEHAAGRAAVYEAEYRLRNDAGAYRWMQARGRAVERDAQGRALRVVGTLVDITDRREAALLRAERDRAEAASRTKSEFVSRMSHELRTPLNAVLGFAQLLSAAQGRLSPQQHQSYVQRIEEGGWHLLELVNDVLDLSRVESGDIALELVPVPLAAMLQRVTDAVGALVQARDLQLKVLEVPEGAAVQADALRLREVLTNLLGNAIKYNRAGGTVRVEVAAAPGAWRISVVDTGLGIAPDKLPHLFEPFNRLGHESSAIEGSGLGLVLARWYVDKMGGRIEVESTLGEGSRFTVQLPAA